MTERSTVRERVLGAIGMRFFSNPDSNGSQNHRGTLPQQDGLGTRAQDVKSVIEAEEKITLPGFITQLKSVIIERGKPPVIIREKPQELPPESQSVTRHGPNSTELLDKIDNIEYRVRVYNTSLKASFTLNGEEEVVTISTTKYPEDEKGELTDGQTIQINRKSRKHVLVIYKEDDKEVAKIRSKKWCREYTGNPPLIGHPAKERDATAKDIRKYSDFLHLLNSKGVIFESKTPPIVNRLPTTPENLQALREAQEARRKELVKAS